jgi:predicted ATP-grasp superfamily ATP-dependent carboligase
MTALVTPGNLRSALAVTRSLGRHGIAVTVADDNARSLAGASRYCRDTLRVPSPANAPQAFVRAIEGEVERGLPRVVMPTDDVTLSLVAESGARLEGLTALPFPAADVIQTAHDKAALIALAGEQGVPTPRSLVVRDAADLDAAVRHVGFPAVVKARVSRRRTAGRWISGAGTHYVHSRAELEAACQIVGEAVPEPLVQEYIPGDGRGVFVLMNRGRLRAAFAHRRLREKPPSGGVSVLSESVPLDPQALEQAARILEALKWHGVAMVEFRRDRRDGVSKLLEINGRFWGSLQLAIDAGVDFPYLLYRLAVDGDVEPVRTYTVGIRLRWWLGDLDWLLLRLRETRGLGDRLDALRQFVRSAGATARAEVLRGDDPAPQAEELGQYVRAALGGAWARLVRP